MSFGFRGSCTWTSISAQHSGPIPQQGAIGSIILGLYCLYFLFWDIGLFFLSSWRSSYTIPYHTIIYYKAHHFGYFGGPAISYYTILPYTIGSIILGIHILRYRAIPYYTILYYPLLYSTLLYYTIPYHTILQYTL